ncbi:MAG: polyprenyl synthetase family protein [Candidatus Melainabacteria bacterium]
MPSAQPAPPDFALSGLPPVPDYEDLFRPELSAIRQALASALSPEGFHPEVMSTQTTDTPDAVNRLWQALRYASLGGGKRIRPVILLTCGQACGAPLPALLPTAAAIEMVHAQSLIHDDLPCMDDDDLRRGQPTLHKAFDEATAVLAGDALLALAFHQIGATPGVPAEALLSVIRDFAAVASMGGLVNGQYIDMQCEGQAYDATTLEYIHRNKTGALFRFSARAGAMLAGASRPVTDALTIWGEQLGLAFQIVDDLLDIEASSETLGKTAGKDSLQEKATYPALYGIESSHQKAAELIAACAATLDLPTLNGLCAGHRENLKAITHYIGCRIH